MGQIIYGNSANGGTPHLLDGLSIHTNANSVFAAMEFTNGRFTLMGVGAPTDTYRYIWVGSAVDGYDTAANNTGMTTIDTR